MSETQENYFYKVYDNFDEAFKAQQEKIKEFLDMGKPIRCTSLDSEFNFDMKRPVYAVLVRAYNIEHRQ